MGVYLTETQLRILYAFASQIVVGVQNYEALSKHLVHRTEC